MTDPDMYRNATARDPNAAEFHHWLVVNIPGSVIGGGNVSALGADTWASYMGPGLAKDTGIHRYVLLLFAQPFGRIPTVDGDGGRCHPEKGFMAYCRASWQTSNGLASGGNFLLFPI